MARRDTNGNANGSGGAAGSRSAPNTAFARTSFLDGVNAAYIEQLQESYQRDPASLDPSWREFFAQIGRCQRRDREGRARASLEAARLAGRGRWRTRFGARRQLDGSRDADRRQARGEGRARALPALRRGTLRATRDSMRALMMIRAYRMRGHLHANLDPLGIEPPKDHEELHPAAYGFTEADYSRKIFIDGVLGLQYRHRSRDAQDFAADLLRHHRLRIHAYLRSGREELAAAADRRPGQGNNLHQGRQARHSDEARRSRRDSSNFSTSKYTGTKRFGLDGGEAMVPALEQIIKRGGALGVQDIVFGMAHRGRLNVLSQVMGKPHRAIFHEFKGGSFTPDDVEGSGDVKYHLGASSDRDFDNNRVHLSLTANPSHLEIVDPVVLGKVRAKQDQLHDVVERTKVLPLLIHGDASFAGQGVIAECFGLSGLKGYRTGGSIHFIINNQIGFTTSPRHSRSSPYPSDTAKMIEAPIIHVNGDDPEAVVYAAKIAIEFRQKFHKPVVIDMFCYRRFGHNEGDEPSFTQPVMYKKIHAHKTTLQIYTEKLVARRRFDRWRGRQAASQLVASPRNFACKPANPSSPTRPIGSMAAGWVMPAERRSRGRSPRPHRRRPRAASRNWSSHHFGARRISTPSHHPATDRQSPENDRDRRGHRLGHGRGARFRDAIGRRLSSAAFRPGQRARHFLAAPFCP